MPISLKTAHKKIKIAFANNLNPKSASDVASYTVTTWQLKRTRSYGSKRYDEKELEVSQATYEYGDVTLAIP